VVLLLEVDVWSGFVEVALDWLLDCVPLWSGDVLLDEDVLEGLLWSDELVLLFAPAASEVAVPGWLWLLFSSVDDCPPEVPA